MHRFVHKAVLCCLLVTVTLFIPPASWAESKPLEKMEPITVKAARGVLQLEKLPTSATVITRQDIEEKNYINVEDMLREELGLDVLQNGTLGSSTTVFMRGAGSSSTLVLIDGVQVNSNTLGSYNFAHIQPDNVERIEILRGPQSTLWGGDAVGGVINIVTRQGTSTPAHTFSFEGGSFATFKETLSSRGKFDRLDYSFTASRIDAEGFSSANENNGNTENDGYNNSSVSLRTGLDFADTRGRADFIGQYIDARIDFDSFVFGVGMVDGPPYTAQDSYYLAAPVSYKIMPFWEISLNPNFAYDEVQSRNQTSGDSTIISRTSTLDLQNNITVGDHYNVLVGGEYQVRAGENISNGMDRKLDNKSAYMQGIFDYEDSLVITAGFRHDVNDSFDDVTTYKFEAAYRFKQTGTRLRGAYGTGFRAPTINDLLFPGFSNPNLQPEENTSWEAGFDQTFLDGDVSLSAVYFDARFENLIQFDLTTFRPENVTRATSRGVESTLKVRLPYDLEVSANYTWNQAFDTTTRTQLRRRAEHKFHANIHHWWKNRLHSLIGVTHKGKTVDGATGTDPYIVVRAALDYTLDKHWKLTLRGENLFDEEYEEISGFGTAGISGYAGFAFSF
ncbi:TonB-dependent receptor plug domain-containing protein [Nitrospina watsonii]|uniref:Vitamin B12 transporter BtuB n=1 Tax=Nitrospina watsonii TaxID=1323948 RepID=A0ABN8W2X2_9BACT|nr:TonB-dependent receptor [Nitrospina watsonii]CAI2719341.1 Putative Vitamin B12 transporter BtuB [Nitrospina watsonii]